MHHNGAHARPPWPQRTGGTIDLDFLVESLNSMASKFALLEERLEQDRRETLLFREDVRAKLSLVLPPNLAAQSGADVVVEGRATENSKAAAAEGSSPKGGVEKRAHQNDAQAISAISMYSANYITQLYTNSIPDSMPQQV